MKLQQVMDELTIEHLPIVNNTLISNNTWRTETTLHTLQVLGITLFVFRTSASAPGDEVSVLRGRVNLI